MTRLSSSLAHAQLLVDRLELLVGRLELLVHRLQLLVGRLELLVGRLQLLDGRLEFLVGGLEFLVGRLELLVGRSRARGWSVWSSSASRLAAVVSRKVMLAPEQDAAGVDQRDDVDVEVAGLAGAGRPFDVLEHDRPAARRRRGRCRSGGRRAGRRSAGPGAAGRGRSGRGRTGPGPARWPGRAGRRSRRRSGRPGWRRRRPRGCRTWPTRWLTASSPPVRAMHEQPVAEVPRGDLGEDPPLQVDRDEARCCRSAASRPCPGTGSRGRSGRSGTGRGCGPGSRR